MIRFAALAAMAALVGLAALPQSSLAQGASNGKSKSHSARRGGYSYGQDDVINTYGDSRGRYGSSNSLRDPSLDKQTEAGPFDHGFFFDSATGARGGDAPYMN